MSYEIISKCNINIKKQTITLKGHPNNVIPASYWNYTAAVSEKMSFKDNVLELIWAAISGGYQLSDSIVGVNYAIARAKIEAEKLTGTTELYSYRYKKYQSPEAVEKLDTLLFDTFMEAYQEKDTRKRYLVMKDKYYTIKCLSKWGYKYTGGIVRCWAKTYKEAFILVNSWAGRDNHFTMELVEEL